MHYSQKLIFSSCLMKISSFFVDKECVRNPYLINVFCPNNQFFKTWTNVERETLVPPKLTEVHIQREILQIYQIFKYLSLSNNKDQQHIFFWNQSCEIKLLMMHNEALSMFATHHVMLSRYIWIYIHQLLVFKNNWKPFIRESPCTKRNALKIFLYKINHALCKAKKLYMCITILLDAHFPFHTLFEGQI